MAQGLAVSRRFLSMPNKLSVITASFSGGGPKAGTEAGPRALISAGLLEQLRSGSHYEVDLDDTPSVYPNPPSGSEPDFQGMKKPQTVSNATKDICQRVYDHARQGKFALTLGGDHSIAIGSVAGTAKAVRERLGGSEMAVVWVDAHADINTPETSDSGNIHGMPVAFVTGIAKSINKDVFGWLQQENLVNVKKFVYIGLRDVDDGEENIIKAHGIKAYRMQNVKRHGIQYIMDQALEYIGDQTPIHLSYDIDSLDPAWASSTGHPVDGGLSLEDGEFIARRLHETGNLVAMDMVEVNPTIDRSSLDQTTKSGCSVIKNALGVT